MQLSLDDSLDVIINVATEDARKQQHISVTSEHVFFVLLQLTPIKRLFEYIGVNMKEISNEILKYMSSFPVFPNRQEKKGASQVEIRRSQSFLKLIDASYLNAVKESRNIVGLKDLLMSFLEIEQMKFTKFNYKKFINYHKLQEVLQSEDYTKERISNIEIFNNLMDDDEKFYSASTDDEYEPDEQVLPKLTTDMCMLAKKKSYDPFIGQLDILDNVFEVLIRRNKNNVIIVGDPGVGKTALVQEFANRIVLDLVPMPLQGFTLLSLDIVSLVAGTRYRGDFEDRVKQLIDSITSSKTNILFLDDIHAIINAGASAGNSNDFGDLIKPLLVDNNIRCIGATTYEEFKKFEKEKTLLRRFNVVEMHEPTDKEVHTILELSKARYESHYNITYSQEMLQEIITLSKKYITERVFPDKALDVLDAIGAKIKVQQYKHAQNKKVLISDECISVNKQDVEEVVSRISKRPITVIRKQEKSNLSSLRATLSTTIFGQEQAIDIVSKVIIRSRTGLREDTKPIASLLFVGPTGVGKTELSKQLANELGMHFQRYDMSEYQERHSISKFIGSPPGYIGHENGGLLIDGIRKHPNSVLLLDEIEKAHNDIYNLLLQIMDYATVTDSTGRKADFRHVIIIMTSNVGAKESLKSVVGFEEVGVKKGTLEIQESVNQLFSPEFRNRLDEVVVFSPLSIKQMKSIVLKELKSINKLMKVRNITIKWDASILNYLIKKGFSVHYGARSILRIIETEVNDKIAEYLINEFDKIDSSTQPVNLLLSMNKTFKPKMLEQDHLDLNSFKIQISQQQDELVK